MGMQKPRKRVLEGVGGGGGLLRNPLLESRCYLETPHTQRNVVWLQQGVVRVVRCCIS